MYRDFIQDKLIQRQETIIYRVENEIFSQRSLRSSFRRNPLVDLLGGGGEGHVLLRAAAHVELVNLSQELLGLRWVCGGGVVRHTVQPAMPGEQEHEESK